VEIRSTASAPGRDPVRQHLDDGVEVLARKRCERRRAPHEIVEVGFLPLLDGAGGDDLLGQDVERGDGRMQGVEAPLVDAAKQCRTLHQLVPGHRVQAALRRSAEEVPGPPHALDEGGQAAG